MILRYHLSLLFLLTLSIGFGQADSARLDSIRNEAKSFFEQVDKIELVELKPFCQEEKHRRRIIGFLGITKKYTACIAVSVIKSHAQNEGIDTTRIGDKVTLEKNKYSKLYELLYFSESFKSNIRCYNPRNGIIFYDSTGEMIGFLEICFECKKIYPLPGTPFHQTPDYKPFDEIKALFSNELLDQQ